MKRRLSDEDEHEFSAKHAASKSSINDVSTQSSAGDDISIPAATGASSCEVSEKDASTECTGNDASCESTVKDASTDSTLKDAPSKSTVKDASSKSTVKDASSESTVKDASSESIVKDASSESTVKDASSESTVKDASSVNDDSFQSSTGDSTSLRTATGFSSEVSAKDVSSDSSVKDAFSESLAVDGTSKSLAKDDASYELLAKDEVSHELSTDDAFCETSPKDASSESSTEDAKVSEFNDSEDDNDCIVMESSIHIKQVCFDEENNRRFSTFLLAQRFPHKKLHYIKLTLYSKNDVEFIFEETNGLFGVDKETKDDLVGNFESLTEVFKSRFFDYTGCEWTNETDTSTGSEFVEVASSFKHQRMLMKKRLFELSVLPSCLDEPLRDIINVLISANEIMKEWHLETTDTDILRDSWLSKETIREGLVCLNNIAGFLEANMMHSQEVATESYKFYLTIPHKEGCVEPVVFKTFPSIRKRIRVLEDKFESNHKTSHMELVSGEERIRVADDFVLHPLDVKYLSFKSEMTLLDAESKEYSVLNSYFQKTCVNKSKIVNIFRCKRQNENPRLDKKYRLLWHGSQIVNLCGLLRDGLHIPKRSASMLRGVYFAECAAKSLKYCYAREDTPNCFLLLCDIAFGDDVQEITKFGKFTRDAFKSDVIKYNGGCVWENLEVHTSETGSEIHVGNPKLQEGKTHGHYNEFVVYDDKRIQLVYLVQILYQRHDDTNT